MDTEKEELDLFKNVELEFNEKNLDINNIEEVEDFIENNLSDKYGYCHYGWKSFKII